LTGEIGAKRLLYANGETEVGFEHVGLRFASDNCADVFASKNNKTLGQTLAHRRYLGLTTRITAEYPTSLGRPLGEFLVSLKRQGDERYRLFLNKYGDLLYSPFCVADAGYFKARGVYAYYVGQELKYIGRCKDSIKKRVNHGYGKIHPKNCYLDGQATNCPLNALITEARGEVSLWLHVMGSNDQIDMLEVSLLRTYRPPWNMKLPD
jgi:hypothetical protein